MRVAHSLLENEYWTICSDQMNAQNSKANGKLYKGMSSKVGHSPWNECKGPQKPHANQQLTRAERETLIWKQRANLEGAWRVAEQQYRDGKCANIKVGSARTHLPFTTATGLNIAANAKKIIRTGKIRWPIKMLDGMAVFQHWNACFCVQLAWAIFYEDRPTSYKPYSCSAVEWPYSRIFQTLSQ